VVLFVFKDWRMIRLGDGIIPISGTIEDSLIIVVYNLTSHAAASWQNFIYTDRQERASTSLSPRPECGGGGVREFHL